MAPFTHVHAERAARISSSFYNAILPLRAIKAHPAIKQTPPIGVIGPSTFPSPLSCKRSGPARTIAYKLPENMVTPAVNRAAAVGFAGEATRIASAWKSCG
jgi:hypothetical protein